MDSFCRQQVQRAKCCLIGFHSLWTLQLVLLCRIWELYWTFLFSAFYLLKHYRHQLRYLCKVLQLQIAWQHCVCIDWNQSFGTITPTFCSSRNEAQEVYKRLTTSKIVTLNYPLCALHFFSNQFSDCFHLTSVLLTTCLGVQMVFAILMPIWTRTGITIMISFAACIACFIMSHVLYIPR